MSCNKYFKKLCFLMAIISVFAFIFCNYSYAEDSYIWSDTSKGQLLEATSGSADLKLESGGAILIEQTTGSILYEHNSHEMFRPASVTKVMSLLLIMEAIDNR